MTSISELTAKLALPLICAPMTGVSGPEMTIAACLSGIVGSFPTSNCGSGEELDSWLASVQSERQKAADTGGNNGALAANLIIRNKGRLADDTAAVIRHKVDFVITSVGSPKDVVGPLHDAGIAVVADVASMHHTERALEVGVDGLVLLSAGAGGHTGWANGFAFVRAVRAMYHGPVIMAGGISDGAALWASVVLGCDLAYMGTKFIATHESRASEQWRQALVDVSLDDIELGVAPNGIAASSIRGGLGSAGHSVSGVSRILSVKEVVAETAAEWNAARKATQRLLGQPARA